MFLSMRSGTGDEVELGEMPLDSVEAAYLDICAGLPDAVAALLRERRDPFAFRYVVRDADGTELLEVPLTELIPPRAAPLPAPSRGPSSRDRAPEAMADHSPLFAHMAALSRWSEAAQHRALAVSERLAALNATATLHPPGARRPTPLTPGAAPLPAPDIGH